MNKNGNIPDFLMMNNNNPNSTFQNNNLDKKGLNDIL